MSTDLSLPALLEELASPREAPAAGSALAVALAAAAAVVQKAARVSRKSWPDAVGVAAQAESLRDRAAQLSAEDAEAYRRYLELAANLKDDTQERRDWALGQALAAAAEPPLAIVRLAADLADLCHASAEKVEPRVRADVVAAAALAAGVARGGRELVAVNLTALPDDPRVAEADRLAARAAELAGP
ncbi:MAG TPA: cyclodeaminase/cyclohydrolase family protein [Gaiellaceae bacterium]|nr:cyclodeaminase/cyclohydrolase family protein [Gaiellaceae bacterium]